MEIYKYTGFCILFFALVCCSPERKTSQANVILSDTGEHSHIDMEFSYESTLALPFDSLMDDAFYVKLETTGNNLIGEISQILFTKDRIIVVDRFVAKSVTVYDMSGKFQNKIGHIGQGPEEYTYLAHVSLSADSSMIIVNDGGTKALKFYSIDGKFIKALTFSFDFDAFEYMTNDLIVTSFSSGNIINENEPSYKPRMIVTNLPEKILYSAFQSYFSKQCITTTLIPVLKYGENVFYNPAFTDTIYIVTPDGLYPRYNLRYKGIPKLKMDEKITDAILDEHHSLYPYFSGEFVDLENALYFTYSERKMFWARFFLYSKAQNKVFTCSGNFNNPYFYAWDWMKTRYKDNYLVSVVQPARIMELKDYMLNLEVHLPPEKRDALHALFQDLTEDDNPVLFFYHVKI